MRFDVHRSNTSQLAPFSSRCRFLFIFLRSGRSLRIFRVGDRLSRRNLRYAKIGKEKIQNQIYARQPRFLKCQNLKAWRDQNR